MNDTAITKEEFIAYLKSTLIPDLRESGRDGTASDFEAAVAFMEGAAAVSIGEEGIIILR